MREAGAALQAFAAGHVHLGAHRVALAHGGYAAAHAGHRACKLVARNQRRMDAPLAHGSQLKMCRSVPQTLAVSTRTSTSPGPGAGTGTSRSSIPGAALGFHNRLHGSGHRANL